MIAASRSQLVAAVLAEYGALTRQVLHQYLPLEEPRRYLYDLVADYPRRGGKMLRPSLCIATACAFGARAQEALQAAVAVELFHNASLVTDDIEDESEMRRGQPTLHTLHGLPLALNAGGTLLLFSMLPLLECWRGLGLRLTVQLIHELTRMARESAEGQALELGWRRDNVIALADADYFEMALKKTCWLTTIYPLRAGALIGIRDVTPEFDTLTRFGFFLGTAFQIRDDVLNLLGDGASYGKEIAGDLLEGKRTLMLIHLLQAATPEERERITAFLATPRPARRAADVRWILGSMSRYGSIDYAQEVAYGMAGAACHEFSQVFRGLPESRDKHFVEELITWVLERTS